MAKSKQQVIAVLQSCCGELDISVEPGDLRDYGCDWTRFRTPDPAAVVFPRNADEVSRLVRVASEHAIALVPSGGRTGLSGGAVAADGEVVVSFEKMRRILAFDPVDRTLTVEAGVVTGAIQQAAVERGLYYPVSFASEGSSQIGGNIATNAGGIRVLRYGLTRDRVAGLKAVDGRGELLELNAGLVKNASGYDFRHLLIGSEGTLALIVEATLKLTEPPPPSRVMLLGATDLQSLLHLLQEARARLALSAFEFFSEAALVRVCEANGLKRPLAGQFPYYALLEFDCPEDREQAAEVAAATLFEHAVTQGWIRDGVISQSAAQGAELWYYREGISEASSAFTPYKNDLSVRLSRMPEYLAALEQRVAGLFPAFEVLWYGHIGDGNLHMNVLKPDAMGTDEFEATCAVLSREVYEVTAACGGSVSAEHGIGLFKQPYLSYVRSDAEIARMQGIKDVFDPVGILNPGKLLRR